MENVQRRRWEVRDGPNSEWRRLPGEFTAKEIWDMCKRGDFWVAMPVREISPHTTPLRDD